MFNGEEALFLYIENRFEIGKEFIRGKENRAHFLNRVADYIKKNNLNFNGLKIFFVVNGLIATSILATPKQAMDLGLNNQFTHLTNIVSSEKEQPINKAPILVEQQKTEVEPEASKSNVTPPIAKKNVTTSSSTIKNKQVASSTPKSNPSTEALVPPVSEPAKKEQTVTVHKSNGKMIELSITDYLIGVVGAEMPASFHEEALKAQAVVARTYAHKLIKSGKRLTDTSSTQNYKTNEQLKALWGSSYNTYYNKIKKAVQSTVNEVVLYNNSYIDAVYHSTSNGRTSDAVDVWGNSVPYLKSVDSKWDNSATSYLKLEQKSFDVLSLILGVDLSSETDITVISRTSNNSVKELKIEGKLYRGTEIRNLLGLRSTDFDIVFEDAGLRITTRGYGHGVGMSQYGANGMAKEGYKYQQIIKHYYTGVTIKAL